MSKDEWIWTITEVMEDFSLGMGVKLKWFHTGRRPAVGERVADTLSGDMKEVEQEMPGALDVSSRKSVVLDRWLNDPGWRST